MCGWCQAQHKFVYACDMVECRKFVGMCVCACVCSCMYVRACVCTRVHVRACVPGYIWVKQYIRSHGHLFSTYTHTDTHTHTLMHTHMQTATHLHTYARTIKHIQTHMHSQKHTYPWMHKYTYTHKQTQTYTHTDYTLQRVRDVIIKWFIDKHITSILSFDSLHLTFYQTINKKWWRVRKWVSFKCYILDICIWGGYPLPPRKYLCLSVCADGHTLFYTINSYLIKIFAYQLWFS